MTFNNLGGQMPFLNWPYSKLLIIESVVKLDLKKGLFVIVKSDLIMLFELQVNIFYGNIASS